MISFYCRSEEILPEAHLPVMLNDELMAVAGNLIKEYTRQPSDMWNLSLLLSLLLLFFQLFDFFTVIIQLLNISAVEGIGQTVRETVLIEFCGIFDLGFGFLKFL